MNNYKYEGDRLDHISATQIETGACLYKYMLGRLQGQAVETEPMREGKFMHEVYYKYTKYCVSARTAADFEEFNRIFEAEFTRAGLPEDKYQTARENALKFAERGIEFDRILDFEERHRIEFAPGRFIVAVFDRTNSYKDDRGSVLEIIDYKNTFKIFSDSEIKAHEQLKIYKYLACCHIYRGFNYIRCGIYHMRYNRIKWTPYEYIPDLTGEFENTENFLNRQWERLIEGQEYPPMEGPACWAYGTCEFMDRCPLYTPERLEKMKAGSLEERIRAWRIMDKAAKDLKKAIQKEFEIVPGREVDGKFVGFKLSDSYKYDLRMLLDYFKKYEITDYPIDVAKTDAERIIKKQRGQLDKLPPEEFEILQAARIPNSSTRFTA